jgi:hypothetical protein
MTGFEPAVVPPPDAPALLPLVEEPELDDVLAPEEPEDVLPLEPLEPLDVLPDVVAVLDDDPVFLADDFELLLVVAVPPWPLPPESLPPACPPDPPPPDP